MSKAAVKIRVEFNVVALFAQSVLKIRPVDAHPYPISVYLLLVKANIFG